MKILNPSKPYFCQSEMTKKEIFVNKYITSLQNPFLGSFSANPLVL